MTTAVVRDYGLVGTDSQLATNSGLVEAEWFRPPIDPEKLRALQVRSNLRAGRDVLAWFGLIGLFGYLAWAALGTWWATAAFFIYGALYGGAADSRWHECGHGTAFASKLLNDVVYYLASFMLLRQPTLWRWSHVRHHTDTIIVGRDPEIAFPRPSSLSKVLGVYLPVLILPKAVWRTLKHAAGRIDDDARDFIPEDELPKLKWESRVYIAVLTGVAVWCVAVGSIVPALFIGLPTFYGAWLVVFFGILQHAGMREDVLDHRYNTRTVYMNPVFRFLYCNMNYHVEHHIFPTVPYYALPALHREVKAHLAPAERSTFSAYRQLFATLRQQWRDPRYDYPRPDIPDVADAGKSFIDSGFVTWAGERHDGLVDLGAAEGLAPGSARRIDRGDATYALYRLDTATGKGDASGDFVLSDGLCTHGKAHLAEGAVLDCVVECPKHNGCFDLHTGEALRRPAKEPLRLYDVEVRNGRVVSRLTPRSTPRSATLIQPST